MDLSWSGWEIKGPLLVAPRRVRLSPMELRLMTILMEDRIAQKGLKTRYVKPERIASLMKISMNSVRRTVAELRNGIGHSAIETSRTHGYRLMDCTGGRNDRSPIQELVFSLKNALAAAERLQLSIKEGLYEE